MACTLQDLAKICGEQNLGGLVGDAFIMPIEDLDTIIATLDADGVTITGNLKPKVGKEYFKVYHTKGKGKLEDNSVGERDGKSFENVVEIHHPGSKAEVSSFKKNIQNTPVIIIVKDGQGLFRVIGITGLNDALSADLPAYAETLNGTTGTASADLNGSTMNFKAEATSPALYYTGVIDTEPVV